MPAATVEKEQTKIQRASIKNIEVAELQTFQEWLEEEAAAGRMILATSNEKAKLPARPKETIDFWSIYNEIRADRF